MAEIRPLADVEREHVIGALEALNWDKRAAAKALGVSLNTIYNKLARWGVQAPNTRIWRPRKRPLDHRERRVMSWIRDAGGSIAKHQLRRKRTGLDAWTPFQEAIDRLVERGVIIVRSDEETRDRSGPPATYYVIA